jgi:hypothetical protein
VRQASGAESRRPVGRETNAAICKLQKIRELHFAKCMNAKVVACRRRAGPLAKASCNPMKIKNKLISWRMAPPLGINLAVEADREKAGFALI